MRDAHVPTVAAVEQGWHARHGAVAAELVAALTAAEARLAPGLPDHVTVRYAVGPGFVDVSSAPAR